MGAEFDKKDAAKEAGTSVKEATNAWHSARQDASLEQIRTGENWNLKNDYAINKTIERSKEHDQRNGDSGK
jgi:hypothetical protein